MSTKLGDYSRLYNIIYKSQNENKTDIFCGNAFIYFTGELSTKNGFHQLVIYKKHQTMSSKIVVRLSFDFIHQQIVMPKFESKALYKMCKSALKSFVRTQYYCITE